MSWLYSYIGSHLHGDAKLPDADGLVIGRADKAPVVIHKGDGVDGSQMIVVLLRAYPRDNQEYMPCLIKTQT